MNERPLTGRMPPGGSMVDLRSYEKAGGYQGLRKALKMPSRDVTTEVKNSVLKGRGGAGFPTGVKWGFVPIGPSAQHPKYVICNADEMEPGTFKDRLLLERDPHQLIEGMIIAGHALEADIGYVFIRGEYVLSGIRVRQAIAEAQAAGYLGRNILGSGLNYDIRVHMSAGRYMCGDETGLLNALEGKRANPRAKPPFPPVAGAFGKPTVVNNVETLCCVPHILAHGAAWFKNLSKTGDGGTKLYGASGRVKKPGLWELPMGTTVRELLFEHAGGMQDGIALRGLLPGGASTDFLTPEHLDVPMDFVEVTKVGSRMGTGTMIILDDKTCPVGMVGNLEHFFARESCGWCTPCWSGLGWADRLLSAMEDGEGEPGDLEKLDHIARMCAPGNTYCALAPGAAEPLQSALKYFHADFERHITEKRCPWK